MNRTRLLMIGVLALALGFFASVYVYRNLQARSGGGGEPGIEVIVAADDLQVGARVEDHDIKIIKIPKEDMPPGAPRRRADVLGHGVIIPIAKGEFILPNRLAGENAGSGLPALIPPGMRAVSVRVNEVVSVAGFVTPGTRVDVLLTGTPGTSGEQETTTVLQNVAVLALASSEGHIQLALRNPLDTKQDEVASSNSRGLYKGGAAPPPKPTVVHQSVPRKTVAPVPPPATGVSIEVYQGDKKPDVVKFPDEGSEAK
jgi:pilus assembly protein CpaB